MSDMTTSYDTPAARARAATMLAAFRDNDRYLWRWTAFSDAADGCARNAARCLLRGETDAAMQWAGAHRLLSERLARGHEEAERRRAGAVAA